MNDFKFEMRFTHTFTTLFTLLGNSTPNLFEDTEGQKNVGFILNETRCEIMCTISPK